MSKIVTTDSKIISFLKGMGTDSKGRHLSTYYVMSDRELNDDHEFIQWMFPSDIPSKYSPECPVLTHEDIEIIKSDTLITASIKISLNRMISFFERNMFWITENNHNFFRLTRILRCLWLSDLIHDYVSLQKALDEIFCEYFDIIGEESFFFWKNANNDLFMSTKDKVSFMKQVLSSSKSSSTVIVSNSNINNEISKNVDDCKFNSSEPPKQIPLNLEDEEDMEKWFNHP